MKLLLHEMTHSPYCIPVRKIFEAYSVSFETIQIPAWDRRSLIELTGGNYYQVPVIEHEGKIIYETPDDPLAVAHFLDSEFCSGELFPNHCAGIQEIIIGHIENTLEGSGFILSDPYFTDSIKDLGERMMLVRHKERSFGRGCVEKWRENQAALLKHFDSLLEPFETRLGNSEYLFGDSPVYADYALYGVLENASFGGHVQPAKDLPSIQRWWKKLSDFKRDRD